ncbi:MAG: small multi-drug export protein [Romboutsia sp.]|nr:small multi-drug export protein [Romboutsia sp.]
MVKLNNLLDSVKQRIRDYIELKYCEIVLKNKEIALDKDEETNEEKEKRLKEELKRQETEVIYINDWIKRVKQDDIIAENIKNKENNNKKKNYDLEMKISFFFLKLLLKFIIIPFMVLDIPYKINSFSASGMNPLLAFILVITFNIIVIPFLILL